MFKNEWINLIIIFTVIIAYDILRRWFILNSKIPQAVIDFPVYQTTKEEYNSLIQEIEPFFIDAFENRISELSLNVKQLNCIATRGVTPIQGTKGLFPAYYEIDNNKIIKKDLSYLCIYSISGYEINIWSTEFAGTVCFSELASINGYAPSNNNYETRIMPFKDWTLFIFLCNFDAEKRSQLAKKLTTVEIKDDKLILKI